MSESTMWITLYAAILSRPGMKMKEAAAMADSAMGLYKKRYSTDPAWQSAQETL